MGKTKRKQTSNKAAGPKPKQPRRTNDADGLLEELISLEFVGLHWHTLLT